MCLILIWWCLFMEKILRFKTIKDLKNYINSKCLNIEFVIDGLDLILYL